jgi:uncharacterized membrane protein YbaN (DUF454 family)
VHLVSRKLSRIILLVAGWTSVLAGVAGVFLPIVPGIALLIVGLTLLSSEYPWAHTVLRRTKEHLRARRRCR